MPPPGNYFAREIRISQPLPDVRQFEALHDEVTELRFWTPAGQTLQPFRASTRPVPQTLVLVEGQERHFWVEFTGPFRRRPALRNVAGWDLRGVPPVGITTDDGRQYLFLDAPGVPRDVLAAFPAGAFRALRGAWAERVAA